MIDALSNEQIYEKAPSVFATEPWDKVSSAYAFIPTIQIVEALRQEGFMPVRAGQTITRIPGKAPFAKHLLRFRHEHYSSKAVGKEIPELVLVNSHDRSSGFRLSAGIFRIACTNGLIVQSANFGDLAVRHSGNIRDEVVEGSLRIIEEMPAVIDAMDKMKGIALDRQEQLAYASAALLLRYPTNEVKEAPITADKLLEIRRSEDASSDLWTTFNTVQENFMKGGVRGKSVTGKRIRTRAIKSVKEDIRLNKALWSLTERMAALKS